jgi:hypothetical protein
MTEPERQKLRALIDQKLRETSADEPGCAGCGCHMDARSEGCRTCTSRWLRRKWRADEERRREERLYDRYRKHLKKKGLASA